jgi:hypothetical protein
MLPFVLLFRWAERPAAPPPLALPGVAGMTQAIAGTALATAGFAVLAANAFPVPGEVLLLPAVGVTCVGAAALALHVDPFGPRRHPV